MKTFHNLALKKQLSENKEYLTKPLDEKVKSIQNNPNNILKPSFETLKLKKPFFKKIDALKDSLSKDIELIFSEKASNILDKSKAIN